MHSYGEERYENKDFQARVRERFAEIRAMDDDDNSQTTPPWYVIHAAQTMDEVEDDIWKVVQPILHAVATEHRPIGKLWTQAPSKGSDGASLS